MSQHIVDLIVASQENLTTLSADYGAYAGYIAAAVTATAVYYLYGKFTVPRQLRHLPNIPFSKTGAAMWRGEAIDITQKQLYLPAYGDHGILVMFSTDAENSSLTARLFGRSNIVFQNGDHWKRHRKIANPAFHRSMPVQLFGALTQALFKKFEADGNRVDVHDYLQRFSLDAIGKAGFGFDFNSIDDTESKWTKIYGDIRAGTSVPLFLLFPVLEQRFLWAFQHRRNLHQKMDQLDKLFMEVIGKKKQAIEQKEYEETFVADNEKDLLTLMIEANLTEQEGKGLSDSELRDNLAIFFAAVRKYEWSLPVDSIHRDGLKLNPKKLGSLEPVNLIVDFHPRY
ncbi:cytochrome P450 [Jimgerdemannia flammicorona]|uniref:Cytochrome P450 n=1 Tax=Jimgerdemannia flammicorona TaxID=994334 RepID=A0A433DJA2_9FUNG|nr:cytochrome P450 [Jimgerdemannia flammicorona]